MRYPPLSLEFILNILVVDLKNGICHWKNPTKYHPRLKTKLAGFLRAGTNGQQRWYIKINGCSYRRAQIILAVSTGMWPIETVDHIDGNPLNDCHDNLRHASILENSWNHKYITKKSTLPMGIRSTTDGKYQARIACRKKTFYLGVFATIAEAEAAYKTARMKYFGKFCGF